MKFVVEYDVADRKHLRGPFNSMEDAAGWAISAGHMTWTVRPILFVEEIDLD